MQATSPRRRLHPPATATRRPPLAADLSTAWVLARRAFVDARSRTVAFAYVFGVYAWLQAAGYHRAYPTLADRQAFARTFAGNDAIRLFYGYPYGVVTVGGYSAWRVGGTLSIAAAAFGVLAAVRALRAEEDAGRAEVVLAGRVTRSTAFWSNLAAGIGGIALLWGTELVGFVAAGLPFAGSAYLALATAAAALVFLGVGALASQLAPSRRTALSLACGSIAVLWLLRVLADTVPGAAWLRWFTPLGWVEETRPFAIARPAALVPAVLVAPAFLILAARLSSIRDVGTGLLPSSDSRRASPRMLSSPTAQALRRETGALTAWALGIGSAGAVLGMVSTSVSDAGISAGLQKDFSRFGAGSITTASGYLSLIFTVFVFALCLFVCSQIGAAREEEAAQRLETLLALPVSRSRWLAGRLVLAGTAVTALSALAGLSAWLGSEAEGAGVPLVKLMEAGANCIPVSVLFLGVSALAFAAAARAASAASYAAVGGSFLWFLLGSLLSVPRWLVDVTPFARVGLVPAQSFRLGDAAAMGAIGLALCAASIALFRRRDLIDY